MTSAASFTCARLKDYKSLEEVMHVTAHYIKKGGGSVWSKLGWWSLSNLETFLNIFWVSYPNIKDQTFIMLWTSCWTIEMTWYWSLSCLHVTCITRFWKVFSICPVWSANGHMLWVKILFLIRSVMSKLIAKKQLFTKVDPKLDDNILKIEPLDEKVCKKLPWLMLKQK